MDRISSLMDGELDAHQADQQIGRLKHDPEAQASWEAFHVIGDTLRGDGAISRDFGARMHARLAAEPTVLAPHRSKPKGVLTYAWSAAASLSAVGLVGWMAFYSPLAFQPVLVEGSTPPTQVARVAPPAAAPEQLASVPSDGKMKEYLIAHQEFSPSTTIQGLAPYIRTVSASGNVKGQE